MVDRGEMIEDVAVGGAPEGGEANRRMSCD